MRKILQDTGTGNDFQNGVPITQEMKAKTEKCFCKQLPE
jgi:hypothetical protein